MKLINIVDAPKRKWNADDILFNFHDDMIPQLGTTIHTHKGSFLVCDIIFDYRNVSNYSEDDPGRGQSMVWVFTKHP